MIRMMVVGRGRALQVEPLEKLPGKVSYFMGDDFDEWRTGSLWLWSYLWQPGRGLFGG